MFEKAMPEKVLSVSSIRQEEFKRVGDNCILTLYILSWTRLKVVPALLHAIPKLDTVY